MRDLSQNFRGRILWRDQPADPELTPRMLNLHGIHCHYADKPLHIPAK